MQNKGKSTFVKNGAINTATLTVNNLKVLNDVVFSVSEAGDEVLMSRRDNENDLPSEKKSEYPKKLSKDFLSHDLKSMHLQYGKNEAIFSGGEDIGNLKICFSIYLLHQSNR